MPTIDYHEQQSELSQHAKEFHRAIVSLIEELEAVDWYNQRVDVTKDQDLKEVLLHNRNEEIEHAAMVLEWLRRQVPMFDEHLRTYLFTEKNILEIEEEEEQAECEEGQQDSSSDLGIGKNR